MRSATCPSRMDCMWHLQCAFESIGYDAPNAHVPQVRDLIRFMRSFPAKIQVSLEQPAANVAGKAGLIQQFTCNNVFIVSVACSILHR